MSRITCLSIFSGSSAFSTRSLRFARMSALTRSMSDIVYLLCLFDRHLRIDAVGNRFHVLEQLRHLHAGERFEQRRHLRGHLGHRSEETTSELQYQLHTPCHALS